MSFFLRKSASTAAASRRTLAAVVSSEASSRLPKLSRAEPALSWVFGARVPSFGPPGARGCGVFGVWHREIHFSAGPLRYRAADGACAETAFDDSYGDEKEGPKNGEEGLEIAKLGISQDIVTLLGKKGITKLFPIQRAVLEPAMQGRDMLGRARTGTGKTLAFGIPILNKIISFQAKHGRGRNPLALVLAPTRELAKQVEKEFKESSQLDTICVYGGSPISQQMRALNYGVDAVVGTPGRIIDLLNRGALNLSEIQFVVLDEADQMLNVGFAEDVEKILDKIPQKHQTMMFSATMPPWIRKLTQRYLKNPVIIDLVGDSDQKLAEGITLYSIVSDNYSKASILGPLIKEHAKGGKCIVFTQTKRDADRLSYSMGRSFPCEALHGDISQNQRERTLSGFRDGRFNILIATDVAARGLDIPNVDLVIHYEMPNTSETFVHRSGRTGRAGKKGTAILIHNHEQSRVVRGIAEDIGTKFIELPSIKVEGGGEDMFRSTGGGRFDGRVGSGFGRSRGYGGGDGGSSYGRSRGSGGDYVGSSFGRSRGFDGPGGFGGSSSRTGSFGDSGSGRFGSFGSSSSGTSSGFGGSSFGRSGGFGNSGSGSGGLFGGPGNSGSGRSGGRFGDSGSSRGYGGSSEAGGSSKDNGDGGWLV